MLWMLDRGWSRTVLINKHSLRGLQWQGRYTIGWRNLPKQSIVTYDFAVADSHLYSFGIFPFLGLQWLVLVHFAMQVRQALQFAIRLLLWLSHTHQLSTFLTDFAEVNTDSACWCQVMLQIYRWLGRWTTMVTQLNVTFSQVCSFVMMSFSITVYCQ